MRIINIIFVILLTLLVFGVVIFIHELGHFLAAKACGIKVLEFAMGMGPKLIKFQKGETLYSLRLFPIGGFCSMLGEDGTTDEDGTIDDERSFDKKPIWKRMIVLVAGAFMNLVLGLIVTFCFLIPGGDTLPTNIVNQIAKDSPVAESGLMPGDKILYVNNTRCYSDFDVTFSILRAYEDTMEFVVERDGSKLTLPDVKFNTVEEEGVKSVSFDFNFTRVKKTPGELLKQTVQKSTAIVKVVWFSIIDLFTGHVSFRELSGPVGTAEAIGTAASLGLEQLLLMLTFITINLGIFNLLPFPALDGGRVVFLLIELIFRRKVNTKVENFINVAGFALLILLSIAVTFSDIIKLITGTK